jgi:hypothetical protein
MSQDVAIGMIVLERIIRATAAAHPGEESEESPYVDAYCRQASHPALPSKTASFRGVAFPETLG